MNISIVEDNKEDRNILIEHIKRYSKENFLDVNINKYNNGETFLLQFNLVKANIVFLDIYMHGMDGLEVAKKIREMGSTCLIIFTSITESFALKSYEVRAFDYLLKPICYDNFSRMMKLLDSKITYSSRFIIVKEGREMCKVNLSQLLYIDYHNHYLQLHKYKNIVKTYKKFNEFESDLSSDKRFLTCYRCVMVNMDEIEKIKDRFFKMKNGDYVPINRKYAKEIKAKYTSYIFNKIEEESANE